MFHGGSSVVYGVGERPNVIVPPKYDDLQMVNRIGWRGFVKFQQFPTRIPGNCGKFRVDRLDHDDLGATPG